ncbi:MAG: hypothetical protein CVV27_08400 [Candidatus Melainabacteria bacterium HGW-Melainabacteria-1]|nr:MAG: hypothetical protein CVV27_08400 [Candidatus Melainabacteria bacterium HGW-Melainabacteria-1]
MVSVILANSSRFVQRRPWWASLIWLCLFLLMALPALAQTPSSEPEATEPQYISGKVTEILSETVIQDEAFGREEKKIPL